MTAKKTPPLREPLRYATRRAYDSPSEARKKKAAARAKVVPTTIRVTALSDVAILAIEGLITARLDLHFANCHTLTTAADTSGYDGLGPGAQAHKPTRWRLRLGFVLRVLVYAALFVLLLAAGFAAGRLA